MSILEKLYDRSDPSKWAHPEIADQFGFLASMDSGLDGLYDLDQPFERRKETRDKFDAYVTNLYASDPESPAFKRREVYQAPGCPEEPETPVEIVVYRPTETKRKRKLPILFNVASGGMALVAIESANIYRQADDLDCIVVSPRYRQTFQAKYPGAINDLHAGYQWIMEHAAELGADNRKITLFGTSSGSFLALSLAYRLKRYGFHPRGAVVVCSHVDNRPIYPTSRITNGNDFNANILWRSSIEYLGENRFPGDLDGEAYPIYATAEETVGLCPVFIHTDGEESNEAGIHAYAPILQEAGVFHEVHVWGGSDHAALNQFLASDATCPYAERHVSIVYGNIRDCWQYDLRRTWIQELAQEQ